MNRLFEILDGINSSDYADQTLLSTDAIESYADAAGAAISTSDAERVQMVGLQWRKEQKDGNGEWSRMRHEAMNSLDD